MSALTAPLMSLLRSLGSHSQRSGVSPMHPTTRRLAAGTLASVALLAAGPLATAGAKGGVPKPPRQPKPAQPGQVQPGQVQRIKVIPPLTACQAGSKGKFSYEQDALGNSATAEIGNVAPNIPVNVVVNGASIGTMTTDLA